jgi:hypothetical protein
MLRFDPARRPSAAQALQHDWFGVNPYVVPDTLAPERRGLDENLTSLLGHDDSNGYPESSYALSEPEESG